MRRPYHRPSHPAPPPVFHVHTSLRPHVHTSHVSTLAAPAPASASFPKGETFAAAGLVLILLIMVVPLPGFLLDLLLALNIAVSLGILLVSFYATRPLDFTVFPGLLLVTTLFRLALNLASTRLILGQGQAGKLIEAFGSFVIAGNYVVGAIVFLVLVLINFVVITKGSGRIAEVAARFTLDALPGKQMAIDADLNAGVIDEPTARVRRKEVAREADFYGAMDGASKFVRGDAVAALIMTAINIVGGLIIGVTQRGMSLSDAAGTFTLLSIGDGLVSQIPALIISTAAGLIVARASGEGNMADEAKTQLLNKPYPLFLTAGFLVVMGLIPGVPLLPFWALAAGVAFMGQKRLQAIKEEAARPAQAPPSDTPAEEAQPADFLLVDPLELEVGYALISLVDPQQGGDLLDRVKTIRQQLASELGVLVPPVRIRDNVALEANRYVIKLRGNPVGEGEVLPGYSLALLPEDYDGAVPGVRTTDPTFGLPAAWVPERSLAEAERLGLTIVEAPAVVTTHLLEVLRTHTHQLLDRQEVRGLLDKVKATAPALIEELTNTLSLGDVQKVLKRLLKERIPIRDLVTILEALADHAGQTKNLDVLTEYARAALAPTITRQFTADDGRVHLIVLDPPLEQHLLELAEAGRLNPNTLGLAPDRAQRFLNEAERLGQSQLMRGWPPVLLTSPVLRGTLSAFVSGQVADLAVLSYHDLTPTAALDVADQLKLP